VCQLNKVVLEEGLRRKTEKGKESLDSREEFLLSFHHWIITKLIYQVCLNILLPTQLSKVHVILLLFVFFIDLHFFIEMVL